MFRRIADFQKTWAEESENTLKVLSALTDASLAQAVAPEARTLGRLAWHVVTSVGEMANRTGLALGGPPHEAPVPPSAADIVAAYQTASQSLTNEVASKWTDATLEIEDDMYGETWPRGLTLFALVVHQTHHRAQMTVLMRQAALKVPGVYGPAREEWSAFGMPAPSV